MPPKVIGLNFKGLFQKNPNTWERGVEDKELPRVLKKEHAEIPRGGKGGGGGDQKKIMWNFHGSWLLELEFPRGVWNTILWNIQG